jgi:redox-sensitive bicupin YhaK (pirin superfamily)
VSRFNVPDPDCPAAAPGLVEQVIVPRSHDIGGFRVARALPSTQRRMVGPFIFLDQMGPGEFITGKGVDVRPHPHIGLATVTYLFEGAMMHRDSLGVVQRIEPGAVNWMTAGAGVVHSERTPEDVRKAPAKLYGIQSWFALPKALEESEAGFFHHPAAALPEVEASGARVRVVLGSMLGATSPVAVPWETIYADASLAAGAVLELPMAEERAAFIVEGAVEIASEAFDAGRLLVFRAGDAIALKALAPSRVLVLGGAVMDGPRYIEWNFVSSSKARIEQAKDDWRAGRFQGVPGETEFIPLPEPPPTVRYP